MAFKFVAILAFVTIASAGVLPVPQVYHPAPVPATFAPAAYAHGQPIVAKHEASYNDHPQYNYAYEVHDEQTGDIKRHSEERDGDVVRGEYSLFDADGFRRVVTYTVDPHSGFNAVVNRIPLEQGKTIVKQVAPVAYVAPAHPTKTIVKQYPVPVAYHQHH